MKRLDYADRPHQAMFTAAPFVDLPTGEPTGNGHKGISGHVWGQCPEYIRLEISDLVTRKQGDTVRYRKSHIYALTMPLCLLNSVTGPQNHTIWWWDDHLYV